MFLQRAMRLRIMFLAVAATTLAGCGGAEVRYAVHLERADHYLAQHNLDKASIEARNALQVKPRALDALDLNAQIEEQRGNWRDAASSFQAALDVSRDDVRAQQGLGKIYLMVGAADRALQVIEPGLRAHPQNADLLAIRGAAEHLQHKNDAARMDAERAVQLAPRNESAIAMLAAIYQQTGHVDLALALLRSAVKQAPDSVTLRDVLASVCLVAAQRDCADEQLRRLVDLRPDMLAPRIKLAQSLAAGGKLDDAQKVLEEAVRKLPKDAAAKVALAEFIVEHRSRAAGEATLRKFISAEPDNYDLRFALGALLQRAGATQDAIAAYREVIDRDGTGPHGLSARTAIAAIDLAAGQIPPAQSLIEQVLSSNPRDANALTLRANIALSRGDPTAAITDLRTVLRDQPQSASLRRTLASAYLAQGNDALAEDTLRTASETAPSDPDVVVELAQLLARTGRTAEAATLLEAAVQRIPAAVQVREELLRVDLAKHDPKAALAIAEQLKTMKGGSFSGFYFAGVVAHQQNRLDDSANELEQALALRPDSIDVLAELARVELARHRGAAFIGRLNALMQREPKNVALLNLAGEMYLSTKDLTQATTTLTQAIAIDPRAWASYRNRARVKLAQNDPAGAMADYESALKLAPLQPQLLVEAASLDEQQGRVDAAIGHYDALYRSQPAARQLAANNLAMLLVTYRKDQASLDRARDLTAGFASSQDGALLDTNGWVRFKRGEYATALSVLRLAAARSPASKVIRFHLAMAELQLGEADRARADLESALSGSARFLGSDEARATLSTLTRRSS